MLQTKTLYDFLLQSSLISKEELENSISEAQRKGIALHKYLLQQKKLEETSLQKTLSQYLDLPFWSPLPNMEGENELIKDLPYHYLKKNLILPLQKDNGAIYVAVGDPFEKEPLDELSVLFGMKVFPILALSEEILSAINKAYGEAEQFTEEIIQDLGEDEEQNFLSELEQESSGDLLDETSQAPVIKLVNHILTMAVKNRASDIHIEPYERQLFVRLRLDGVLYNFLTLSRRLHASVVSRIKVMAGLNIAEKRLPQDGRIEIKIGNKRIDLRVSCLPTTFGERVVLRLLEKDARLLSMEELGLGSEELSRMKKLVQTSHGIILVTGPTGSGKTTTLYSALNYINTPDKNILTVEDPIEYQLEGIGQMQVNAKIGLTFANALRSMVRQDPDVILVGEIRDLETAEIAIQAALTGHLVFSTLHTNDASSAMTRLINMGIEPFLVSSSIRAIIAQRLVRILCKHCKEPFYPETADLLNTCSENGLSKDSKLYQAQGCEKCLNTGFRGRTAIFEFLNMNEELQALLLKSADSNQIRQSAVRSGMRSLRQDGFLKVSKGETSIDEVLRVTQV